MSQQDIQEKIAVARKEADSLKDKIKATKDQTADTSRELSRVWLNRIVSEPGAVHQSAPSTGPPTFHRDRQAVG